MVRVSIWYIGTVSKIFSPESRARVCLKNTKDLPRVCRQETEEDRTVFVGGSRGCRGAILWMLEGFSISSSVLGTTAGRYKDLEEPPGVSNFHAEQSSVRALVWEDVKIDECSMAGGVLKKGEWVARVSFKMGCCAPNAPDEERL